MNKQLVSKRGNPKYACLPTSPARYHKNKRRSCLSVGKKAKENKTRKIKAKKVVKHLTEFSENESSSRELKKQAQVKNTSSTDSVIYLGTSNNSPHKEIENISLIDLTNKDESLKTLYFNQRNFERDFNIRKSLATTSLVNLSVIKKIVPKKLNSTSVLGNTGKLSVLDIPPQFLNNDDVFFNDLNIMRKCHLTDSDNEMVKWILQKENEYFDLDISVSPCSSGYYSSINTGLSIEDMIRVYEVSSYDNFD